MDDPLMVLLGAVIIWLLMHLIAWRVRPCIYCCRRGVGAWYDHGTGRIFFTCNHCRKEQP